MKNNIDKYRKELEEYSKNEIDKETDYKYKYLQERLRSEILYDRLRNCKNDNNILKQQYLQTIHFLTGNKSVKTIADVCGRIDKICLAIMSNFLSKYKKLNADLPIDIIDKYKDKKIAKQEWDKILETIIHAFNLKRVTPFYNKTKEIKEIEKKGMEYFIKYLDYFWI